MFRRHLDRRAPRLHFVHERRRNWVLPLIALLLSLWLWIRPNVAAVQPGRDTVTAPSNEGRAAGVASAAAPYKCRTLMSFYDEPPVIQLACIRTVYKV